MKKYSYDERVSTGLPGFDKAIDHLRMGDNVVWQVEKLEDFRCVCDPFVAQAVRDRRRIVYFRFGNHAPLLKVTEHSPKALLPNAPENCSAGSVSCQAGSHSTLTDGCEGSGKQEPSPQETADPDGHPQTTPADGYPDIVQYNVDASLGFEHFTTEIHRLIGQEGEGVFYVFDCLSGLLDSWCSDLMIGNFFRVTCPYLFDLFTVAYFPLLKNAHTYESVARIRETTQLLLDLYRRNESTYIHPLKVWERYSPTMFFPHLITENDAVSITSSSDAAELFGDLPLSSDRPDFWNRTFSEASGFIGKSPEEQLPVRKKLISILIGRDGRMEPLAQKYFSLESLIRIQQREIGTGFIGGKAVGMLLARNILSQEDHEFYAKRFVPHDSFYLGADVYYTYIVQNGLWNLRLLQKTKEGYYKYARELHEKILTGRFPHEIREQFRYVLEYFGQSPIIVRSSSLLEDNFGNAFAGKYDSVFCVNQGSPDERYEAFVSAIREVYASMLNEDALRYRENRGLAFSDEQMAILIMRVAGNHYGDYFFPHVAGVGNSQSLFMWDKNTDIRKGMIRLVFGLGTRAVNRVEGDYPRIVCLDRPERPPMVENGDEKKFSQHFVDVLNLADNKFETVPLEAVDTLDLKANRRLFLEEDRRTAEFFRENGMAGRKAPQFLSFKKMLTGTDFPASMEKMLSLLENIYDYPVDTEFTVNFSPEGEYRINLLQCRPLQTKSIGPAHAFPENVPPAALLFGGCGSFMGGNVSLSVDCVIFVKVKEYLTLSEQDKYMAARIIGMLNEALNGRHAMLIGPGRWGTTTASLGVPVHFTELCHMDALVEVSYPEAGLMPDISYGSHFFQDLVESGIFYAALFQGSKDTVFRDSFLLNKENALGQFLTDPKAADFFHEIIHVADFTAAPLTVASDVTAQKFIAVGTVPGDSN